MEENTKEIKFFEDYSNLIEGIESITKTSEGYGYTYLELTPLLQIVLPKLHANNFILVQTVKQSEGTIVCGGKDRHIETPTFVLHSELIHKTGKTIECDMPLYVDDIDPQAIGSAETYMRRYSIYALLNIKVVDDDGLKASARGKANKVEQENKKPLPENLEELGTFLMSAEKPQIYYRDIKKLNEDGKIDDNTWYKLKKIMYPTGGYK